MANIEQMAGAFWFIQSLIVIEIMYCLVGYCGRRIGNHFNKPQIRNYIQFVVTITTMILGFIFYKINFNVLSIGTSLSAYILFGMGELFGKNHYGNVYKKYGIFLFVCSAVVLIGVYVSPYHVSLNANIVVNPFIYILTSLSGWIVIYTISYWITTVGGD